MYCFYSHGKKRVKKIQSGKIGLNESDLFDAFRVSTTIHGRYYKDSHTILGRTYGVCVLQDFEGKFILKQERQYPLNSY